MNIFTHTLCGAAAGTAAASFSKNLQSRFVIVFLSAFGGALAAIDAISLWSAEFDGTIGALFGLAHSGKDIYSGKFRYSRHAFMHFVFAGVSIAAAAGLTFFILKNKFKNINFTCLKKDFFKNKLLFIGFLSGYSGRTAMYHEYEQKSKDIQRELLGDKLYGAMEETDRKLPIYF